MFILFSAAVIIGKAQDYDRQLKYAMHFYDREEYFNAVTEFKRLLFFDSSGTFSYTANYHTGKSYREGGRFNNAIEYFSKARFNAGSQKELFESGIEVVKCNILRGTYDQAHTLLNRMEEEGEGEPDQIYYWRGWIYIFDDQWEKAEAEFRKIKPDHQLAILAAQVENDRYSVVLARTLSFFIPGSGQFYTGNYVSGLMSLGWNILWGYITVSSFVEERIFDGFVTGNLLWLRFYRGNVQNAEDFAIERNNEIRNRALKYLQIEYRGDKP